MAESKYTPDRVERILTALREGLPIESAANYGGIHKDTFYEWLKQHSDFSDAVKDAESEAEFKLVQTIQADPSWQSKAWILERRHPDRWGKVDRNKVELTGKDGGPIEQKVELSLSERMKKYEHLFNATE